MYSNIARILHKTASTTRVLRYLGFCKGWFLAEFWQRMSQNENCSLLILIFSCDNDNMQIVLLKQKQGPTELRPWPTKSKVRKSKFAPWLKIWNGSIFGVLFVCSLFVCCCLYAIVRWSVGRSIGRSISWGIWVKGWGILGDLGGSWGNLTVLGVY